MNGYGMNNKEERKRRERERARNMSNRTENAFYTNKENNGIMKPSFKSIGEVNRAIDKATGQLDGMHHEQYLKMINGERTSRTP